jgi:hypothetical protein
MVYNTCIIRGRYHIFAFVFSVFSHIFSDIININIICENITVVFTFVAGYKPGELIFDDIYSSLFH